MELKGFSTKCIHGGEEGKYEFDVIPPIHLSSTYQLKYEDQDFVYSRVDNPTRRVLEDKMTVLEKGVASLAFSSGIAAISTVVLSYVKPGEEVILSEDIYGGTKTLFMEVLSKRGIKYKYVDTRYADRLEDEISGDTRLIMIESPSNPMMRITDIKRVSEIAHRHGLKVAVDNTFASPYLQNPIELGADITIHSATKYLGGHSDIIAGTATFKSMEDYELVKLHRTRLGGVLSPFDSYLLLRSIKTLEVRMERHCKNAMEIAEYLSKHPKVENVLYPFLKSFPQYDLARRQMRLGGGMISFKLYTDDQDKVDAFLNSLSIMKKAVSLGGVETLIEQPATMTHRALPDEEKERLGITPGLIRLSVGIENVEDLISDLENALRNI